MENVHSNNNKKQKIKDEHPLPVFMKFNEVEMNRSEVVIWNIICIIMINDRLY